MKSAVHWGSLSKGLDEPRLLRPSNLDLLSIIPADAEPRWRRKICQGKLAYVVHALCELRAKRRSKEDDYVPLSHAVLAQVIGTRYTSAAIRLLLGGKVIETDGSYIAGMKCRGYRFTPTYRTIVEAFPPLKRIAKSNAALRQRQLAEAVGRDPNHKFIFESLSSLSWMPEVHRYINDSEHDASTQVALRLSCDNLRVRRISFRVGTKSGRVFHNVTEMSPELRRYLMIDGKPCEIIDISNAQPVFVAAVYPEDPCCSEERHRYSRLVCRGHFYETLNVIAGRPYDDTTSDGRERVKKAFQHQVLSGKTYYRGRIRDAFTRLFPKLMELIDREKVKDHAALTIRLMQLESNTVVHRTIARLRTSTPAVKAVTIHDAILCPTDSVRFVSECLIQETESTVGIKPTLRRAMGQSCEFVVTNQHLDAQ